MVAYLSPEWFTEANLALAARADLGAAWADTQIVLQQIVADAPTPAYALTLDADGARLTPGEVDTPTATFRLDYSTASQIASGKRSAQAAFQAGDLHIEGQVNSLIAGLERLAALDDVLVGLRDRTTY